MLYRDEPQRHQRRILYYLALPSEGFIPIRIVVSKVRDILPVCRYVFWVYQQEV